MLTEAADVIASYLATALDTLAATLLGTAHLLFADHQAPPTDAALRKAVAAVMTGAICPR